MTNRINNPETISGHVIVTDLVGERHAANNNIYDLPCDEFLINKIGKDKVSNGDFELLNNLMIKYGFDRGVVNVLIEYCLKVCDNYLIQKYVEVLAQHLQINKVNNVDDVIMYFEQINNKK